MLRNFSHGCLLSLTPVSIVSGVCLVCAFVFLRAELLSLPLLLHLLSAIFKVVCTEDVLPAIVCTEGEKCCSLLVAWWRMVAVCMLRNNAPRYFFHAAFSRLERDSTKTSAA